MSKEVDKKLKVPSCKLVPGSNLQVCKIINAKPGVKGLNIVAKVVEIGVIVEKKTMNGQLRVGECHIGG
jgi:hypothetical protein